MHANVNGRRLDLAAMSHHLHEVGVENAAPSWCRCYRGRTAAARALSDMAEFPDWLLQRKDFRAILDSKSEPWLYALRKKPYNRDGKDKKALVDWIKEGPMAPELKKLAMDPVVIADMIIVRTYDGAQSGSASVICQEADEPGTLYMLLKGEALASSERTGANEKPSSRRTINASRKKKTQKKQN